MDVQAPREEETATGQPQRTQSLHKVIENMLVWTNKTIKKLWKLCKVKLPRRLPVKELKAVIANCRTIFNDCQLEVLYAKELAAGTNTEILEDLAQLEETLASCKGYLDSKIDEANEDIKTRLLETKSRSTLTSATSSRSHA